MSNKKITEIEINAIKKISSNAAIGEWIYDEFNNEIHCGEYLISRDTDYEEDAKFIVAARQAIPKLVTEVERLYELLDELTYHVDSPRTIADMLCDEIHSYKNGDD